jgi:hypothetical protein
MSALSPTAIENEYRRLGHALGWRFLTCPERNIDTASVALVTTNPGVDRRKGYEHPIWSVKEGSAYAVECWKGNAPGQQKLQIQVLRMFKLMGVEPEDVLSGYLVPFRSRNWNSLPKRKESLRFGCELWREVFIRANARTVVAFGKQIKREMSELLGAEFEKKLEAAWGAQTIEAYRFGSSGKLVMLPPDKINDLPVKKVNDTIIYIHDVAYVHDGSPPQTNLVRVNGAHAVLMTILKAGATSTLDVISGIKALLPRVKEGLPAGLNSAQHQRHDTSPELIWRSNRTRLIVQ